MVDELQILPCRVGRPERWWLIALPLAQVRYVFPADESIGLPPRLWPGIPQEEVTARWGIVVEDPSPSWLPALHVDSPRGYPLTALHPIPPLLHEWQHRLAVVAFVLTETHIIPVIDLARDPEAVDHLVIRGKGTGR